MATTTGTATTPNSATWHGRVSGGTLCLPDGGQLGTCSTLCNSHWQEGLGNKHWEGGEGERGGGEGDLHRTLQLVPSSATGHDGMSRFWGGGGRQAAARWRQRNDVMGWATRVGGRKGGFAHGVTVRGFCTDSAPLG